MAPRRRRTILSTSTSDIGFEVKGKATDGRNAKVQD